jgi:hypothetical protein
MNYKKADTTGLPEGSDWDTMTIRIILSTGKEIDLTPREYEELKHELIVTTDGEPDIEYVYWLEDLVILLSDY